VRLTLAEAQLHSKNQRPGSMLSERVDPFWNALWSNGDGGPTVAWTSLRSQAAPGSPENILRRLSTADEQPPVEDTVRDEAQERSIRLVARRPWTLRHLARVMMWRAITAEQLNAMDGSRGLSLDGGRTMRTLWDAGLIQSGCWVYGPKRIPGLPTMFRPVTASVIERQLAHRLHYADWIGISGGQIQPFGHHYDRHNLLTSELSLRAAELIPLAAVMGEGLAAWRLIFDPSAAVPISSGRAADAIWLRQDGLKLAIETTAHVTAATGAKVQQAADLLARDRSKDLTMLFVDVGHPQVGPTPTSVSTELRRLVERASRSSREHVQAGVPERIAIARWTEWFPEPGVVDTSFMSLSAYRPTGPESSRWEPVDLLDPFSLPFAGSPNAEASLTNVRSLYGIPHWQRDGRGPDLVEYLMDHFQVPPPLRKPPVTRLIKKDHTSD
jgi:hypothetical protein